MCIKVVRNSRVFLFLFSDFIMYMLLTVYLRLFLVCDGQSKDWSSFPSKELCPIRNIIENDDADAFDSFLRKSKIVYHNDDEMLKYSSFEMCPYGILGKMCHHRAVKCATKLLSPRRKLGSLMKLNIVNCYGSYPLHDASLSLSPSMIRLFLNRGADPNVRSVDAARISPMEFAVESLRYVRHPDV